MKQFLKWTGAALLLASLPLAAEDPKPAAEPELPNASVDVSLQFASNYVFRGADVFQNRFNQKRQSISGVNEAWTFQPSITFKTPVDGLYFNIWGNFAMEGREDKDTDQRLQTTVTSPGTGDTAGSNILIDSIDPTLNGGAIPASYVGTTLTSAATYYPGTSASCTACVSGTYGGVNNITVPALRKESNGLKRFDEIDLTIGYGASTKVGVIGFGIVTYNLVNPKAKANPFGNVGGTYYITEIFGTYALPMFPDLTAKIYGDIVTSSQYYQLVYAKTINVNDSVAVSVSTGPGYSIQNNGYSLSTLASAYPQGANLPQTIAGWRDWTSSVGVTVKGFNVNVNAAYRPDLRFFDGDMATSRLVELDGGSTNDDGLVADPKYVGAGPVGDIYQRSVSRQMAARTGNASYSYTPRQKLPKWVYWVNLGDRKSVV